MAQTGYTPILIYSSTTVSQAPSASNLTNSTLGSELAINITDGKLFYKDNLNAVQVIGWKTTPTSAGGTGLTSYTAGDLLYYASGTTLTKLGIGVNKTILTSTGSAPQWSTSLDTTQGGTGVTSYTAGDLTYYATGTTLTKLAIGASTTILTSSGTAPQWTAASSVAIGTATNLAGGAAGSVPYQSGAGATTFVSIGSAYQALQVNAGGTAPSWQASATSTLTAQGDLLYASAANTLARLAKNTSATRYLSNTGSSNNPAWAQIDLSNGVTGTLPTDNGGTGLSSFTAGDLPYYATGTALSKLGIGAANRVLTSTGSAPQWVTALSGLTQLDVDNIRVDGNTISSTDTNGNIVLAPNGTGDVQVDADTLRVGDANANATVTTNGTGDLILNTNSGTNSGSITIFDAANGNIDISPNGSGTSRFQNRMSQTDAAAAYCFETTKYINNNTTTALLTIDVPASPTFGMVEIMYFKTYAPASGFGTSKIGYQYMAFARNDTGFNVVLDDDPGTKSWSADTTTAGGATNATAASWDLARAGAEPNTATQVVNLNCAPNIAGYARIVAKIRILYTSASGQLTINLGSFY